MSRGRNNGRSKNPPKQEKQLIYAFYEGESEKQYLKLLKNQFSDAVVIKISPKAELFKEAVQRFQKFPSFRNEAEVTDEIWFFFDAGDIDGTAKNWDTILPYIKTLRNMRKKPEIRIRLLMTTGCLEYWLMLHFRKYRPAVQTKEQRDQVVQELSSTCLSEWGISYEKGNAFILGKIYEAGIDSAMKHGAFYLLELENLNEDGLPVLSCPLEPDNKELDKRYAWLLSHEETFTTVQEAIAFLQSRPPLT